MDDLNELEQAIGYRFENRALLVQALTHSSHTYEHPGEAVSHNEQLEFLGDAILGFIVSRELFGRFPGYSEGQLSKMKAHLVSATHLLAAASKLRLGDFLQLGRGEERSGGRMKPALRVDAMEAVIAAIYLDGGVDKAAEVVRQTVLEGWVESGIETFPFADFKSALQEYLQAARRTPPRYSVAGERGPEHRKMFTVEVRVGKQLIARAEGPTKKTAEQEAARNALLHFREVDQEGPAGADANLERAEGNSPGAEAGGQGPAPDETG